MNVAVDGEDGPGRNVINQHLDVHFRIPGLNYGLHTKSFDSTLNLDRPLGITFYGWTAASDCSGNTGNEHSFSPKMCNKNHQELSNGLGQATKFYPPYPSPDFEVPFNPTFDPYETNKFTVRPNTTQYFVPNLYNGLLADLDCSDGGTCPAKKWYINALGVAQTDWLWTALLKESAIDPFGLVTNVGT